MPESGALYMAVFIAAIFVGGTSYLTMGANTGASFFALNRYELFPLFIFFAITYPIYHVSNSDRTDDEERPLKPIKFMSFIIPTRTVLLLSMIVVLICVFITP